MRSRVAFGISLAAAVAAVALGPWCAYGEARRQAYAAESERALGYARDLSHRADETANQAFAGIDRLGTSGLPPCSPEQIALMRRIDLTSTYIQAIGHVRDGAVDCSSLGAPLPLGGPAYRTSTGVVLHGDIPVNGKHSVLLGIERDGYVALVHRDLPLDISTAVPGVTLAVLHTERPGGSDVRGAFDPAWMAPARAHGARVFGDGRFLVATVRSERYLTVGLAAVPMRHVQARTRRLAWRLVPAGLFAGLAVAAILLLLARRQLSLPAALRSALRRDEFFLVYQPLVDLRTGAWVGAEALLRWRRGTGELVGPDLFIPVAEQTGLITRLTERVLRLLEADASRFLAEHPGFHVAINLSAQDLRSDAVVAQLDAILARGAIRPANLLVEITEGAFVDPDAARKVIGALRARGIAVAVDDFGTGYSSLQYLESFDLDYLKIDRAFIEAIGTEAPTSQVVAHIIAMARAMDLGMIAEGVERPAQADYLRAQGVQHAQGWLYAKALPFADLARQLDARHDAAHPHADAA